MSRHVERYLQQTRLIHLFFYIVLFISPISDDCTTLLGTNIICLPKSHCDSTLERHQLSLRDPRHGHLSGGELKEGGKNAVLSQVANVLLVIFWLVVGCWLQL